MNYPVEEVFRTEGVPQFTFIKPPNFNEILVDLRNPGKPVIIEGQSGTGKTTTIKKIIELNLGSSSFDYLSARKSNDMSKIIDISKGKMIGNFVIDDFHRLNPDIQEDIANLIKIAAEEYDNSKYPKIVIIGINKVGSELIHLVHDIAKRCGIHRIKPADQKSILLLIENGELKLNIAIDEKNLIFEETKGDYWLTQMICQTICLMNDVTDSLSNHQSLNYTIHDLRKKVTERLENNYNETVKEFCRGRRFRSTNDPYFKLLKCISEQPASIVDLTELANTNPDVSGSINNIKESRLKILLDSKPICERYFYYNPETKLFAIEDPALFYYIKYLNWDELRKSCGFRETTDKFEFDYAISFAGENRELAKILAHQIESLDCIVFFDEFFEANYLGKAWHSKFKDIFRDKSRYIICLLDNHHLEKIWPTFERECFLPRISDEAVIPIYLDDSIFPGIPRDTVGINFDASIKTNLHNRVTDEILFKLIDKLDKT
ncbi:hypothetical protein P3G55_17660 [Leptospira sp. 96542]|nr:hypothetical protein [Leptospira sp. 96542]